MCLLTLMCETLAHSLSAAFGEMMLNKDQCNASALNGLMIEHSTSQENVWQPYFRETKVHYGK